MITDILISVISLAIGYALGIRTNLNRNDDEN